MHKQKKKELVWPASYMPNEKNKTEVNKLREKIAASKSVVFAEYHGLKASDIDSLRARMKDAGTSIQITKNKLLAIALKEEGYEEDLTEALTGPVATFFGHEDSIKSLKALSDFIQEFGLPKIKAGYVDKTYTSSQVLDELSKIPSVEVLIAKMLGSLKLSTIGFVSLLGANQRNFVNVLSQIKDAKPSLAEIREEV